LLKKFSVSVTGFSLSKPVPGFKTGYRLTGSRLTSLVVTILWVCGKVNTSTRNGEYEDATRNRLEIAHK